MTSIVPAHDGFLLQFQAVNEGGTTADGVIVEGELKRGMEKVESSQTTITHLPAESERGGGLYFSQDPRQFDFRVRALGYEEP